MSDQPYTIFICPICGSRFFGARLDADRREIVGYDCNDAYEVGCKWHGPRDQCHPDDTGISDDEYRLAILAIRAARQPYIWKKNFERTHANYRDEVKQRLKGSK
jgi:predicted RNA-binding Zn-ribbon protein involved in translation (DUF1610 family)